MIDPATVQRVTDFLTATATVEDGYVLATAEGRELTLRDLRAVLAAASPDPEQAAHTLVGPHPAVTPGGQLLVTVWGDGTGEAAWRPHESATWGPPTTLTPAP